MAILKQNGVNGKILRAQQSGKALKQNYNFGNSFKKTVGITGTIDISDKVWDKIFYMWFAKTDFGRNIWIYDINSFTTWFRYSDRTLFFFRNNLNRPAGAPISSSSTDIQILYYTAIDFSANKYSGGTSYNNFVWYNKASEFPNFTQPTEIRINLENTGTKINNLAIYDRALSDIEISYRNNNKLGNKLLNTTGLIMDFKMGIAEIIDFGGVIGEAVGIRNSAKNSYHIKLNGLPAGTLTEQLDYANANLFEPW